MEVNGEDEGVRGRVEVKGGLACAPHSPMHEGCGTHPDS